MGDRKDPGDMSSASSPESDPLLDLAHDLRETLRREDHWQRIERALAAVEPGNDEDQRVLPRRILPISLVAAAMLVEAVLIGLLAIHEGSPASASPLLDDHEDLSIARLQETIEERTRAHASVQAERASHLAVDPYVRDRLAFLDANIDHIRSLEETNPLNRALREALLASCTKRLEIMETAIRQEMPASEESSR